MQDPNNPEPYIAEDGSVIIPLFGKPALAGLNALLMAYSDDPPKKKRKRCQTKSKKTTTPTAKRSKKK